MFRCHLMVSVVMLRSRKIRLQPAEELPQSQNSAGNCVEILETMPQGYDCWCIFSRLKSGRCQKVCRRLRQNGIKSSTCKTCCVTAQALPCYWCLHQRQVVFFTVSTWQVVSFARRKQQKPIAQLAPQPGWVFTAKLGSFEAHDHHSFAAGTFRCHWIKFFANPLVAAWFSENFWIRCVAGDEETALPESSTFTGGVMGMAFLEAFFVGRRPPFCPLFILFREVSTSALEDGKMIRFGERGTNRWIDGNLTKETLMLTLKMQKRRRTTYPQKEKVRFDVFLLVVF